MATDMYTIQIRQRGVVTLPNALREAYGLGEDDVLTLVDLGGTFVLSPRVPMISKLARSIEKKREQSGISVEELLDDLYQDRHGKE